MQHGGRSAARGERGAVSIVLLVGLAALIMLASLSVDVGHMMLARTRLQRAADAIALAAVAQLPDEDAARSRAIQYADLNDDGFAGILDPSDVEIGNWDFATRSFSAGANPRNSVRVAVERSPARGNPLQLTFSRVMGRDLASARAGATAYQSGGGPGTRFLIDEELIDTDIPAIEELAERLGKTPDELLGDADDDWFIDLPPGEELTLPTGQVGDEGLFDIAHDSFEFSESSSPSYTDFLNFNEDGSWRQNLVPKEMLDPLMGPTPVNDPAEYPDFVDPDFCNVSPVFKSDISELNPVGGEPAVNGLGERRGLLSFQVIDVGADPDGPGGSYLPDLVIRICEPGPVAGVSPPGVTLVRPVLVE